MRRILSLALLSLALPFAAMAQTDATPVKPPTHGTPQDGQDAAAAKTTAKPAAKKAAKPAAKPAATANDTGTHGTPQGLTQK